MLMARQGDDDDDDDFETINYHVIFIKQLVTN